jgi:Ketopantoate reductase PanE/ApbA
MSSYAIIGTGALGGYDGAKLQRAGLDVHFLVNSDYQHIKTAGLVIRSKDGDFTLPSVNADDRSIDGKSRHARISHPTDARDPTSCGCLYQQLQFLDSNL